eukprot:655712-Pyramimonas_sp.AAC.1
MPLPRQPCAEVSQKLRRRLGHASPRHVRQAAEQAERHPALRQAPRSMAERPPTNNQPPAIRAARTRRRGPPAAQQHPG